MVISSFGMPHRISVVPLVFRNFVFENFHHLYFSVIVSVVCYEGGSGLKDPCETGVVDASAKLTAQERANITLSAQVRN